MLLILGRSSTGGIKVGDGDTCVDMMFESVEGYKRDLLRCARFACVMGSVSLLESSNLIAALIDVSGHCLGDESLDSGPNAHMGALPL